MTTRKTGAAAGRSPFGELLLTLRTRRGLTQERLARGTDGDRISARSITSYEQSAKHAKNWVLPHRSGLRLLAQALDLDMVDRHALAVAWNNSRNMRNSVASSDDSTGFIAAGREHIVQAMMEAWTTAQNGTPQMVFLGGVSAIGKSTLVRHVSDTIAASTKEVMVAWGSASSWATDVEPYLPIRTAMDRILEPPDPSGSVPGKYRSRPNLSPQNIQRIVESIPLLAGALISERAIRSMPGDTDDKLISTINDQLLARTSTDTTGRLEEYSRLLTHFSKSWPIVLVLEDLHWASDPTASLLLHLSEQFEGRQNTPILLIATFRNNEIQHDHNGQSHPVTRLLDSTSRAPFVRNLSLNNSKSSTSAMAYVRGAIARTPMISEENAEQFAEWLYSQTSGHPLLTGELIRHAREVGTLSRKDGSRWEFDANKIPEQVPEAISAFIEQRLNRVESPARRILDIAAAMNDVILTEIVAEIMQTDEEDVLEIIDYDLVETHQLLLPGATVQLLDQSHESFRFPHALYREHIYTGLPRARRRKLHLAIAQAMEQRYADADTTALSEITSHYVLAEDWHSAQMAGYRLAQHAVIKLDWDLANVWFKQAEELAIRASDPAQLWRTRAARLAMLRGTGKYDEALEQGARILELGDIHQWPGTQALTYHHLGEIYYDLGEVDTAVDHLQKALKLHLQEDSLDLAAAGYAMLSHATNRQGKYDISHEHALSALKLSRELNNSWVQPEAVLAAANCEIELGYYEEAIQNYQLATELATMVGKLHNQFIPPMNIGLGHTYMGNHEMASELLSDLIKTMESQTIYRLTAPARLYLGYALEAQGRLEEAADSYAAAAKIRRTKILPPTLYDAVAGQLRVALLQKDDAAAKKWMIELTTHLKKNGPEGIEEPFRVLTSVAKANRHFGDEEAYRKYITQAYELMMDRAGMLEDDASRHSYLTNVPINKELQRLHAELQK